MTTPQLIAHRGAPRERPENTLPAFLRALELGADGIELDVHTTRDGVVVVHHDEIPRARAPLPSLANTRIDALTFEELQGFAVRDLALIPTLAEVLAVVKGRVDVYIELKGADVERAVIEVVRASLSAARCALHAFDHAAVARAHALAPEMPTGILAERGAPPAGPALREAHARDYWAEWRMVDEALVSEVHDAGGRVIAWTVNDGSVAARFAAWGVDGLCTDNVPALRGALVDG